VQTFVLRVWTPAVADGSPVRLNGLVEHVGSGRRQAFAGGPEVLEFITDCLREGWGRPVADGESPLG
jgi:hypothetical protein